jgi:hypothetical protein
VPSKPPRPRPFKERLTELIPYQFSGNYWRNNKQFLTFLYFILLTNIILFVMRAYYFRNFSMLSGTTPNPFYMLSRANGRCLLFNSTIILVLVLRYTVTKLRELGLSNVLPLDHNIYLHKVPFIYYVSTCRWDGGDQKIKCQFLLILSTKNMFT